MTTTGEKHTQTTTGKSKQKITMTTTGEKHIDNHPPRQQQIKVNKRSH